MLTWRSVLTLACVLVFAGLASVASAQTIPVTAHITADNHYALYVGNEDGTELTFIGRNEYGTYGEGGSFNWTFPETWNFDASIGLYLYIAAWDECAYCGQAMLIGDFTSNGELLVTNELGWESVAIAGQHPANDDGDPALADVVAAIRSDSWVRPTWVSNPYYIQGVHPSARQIWHGPYTGPVAYALFRAPVAALISCDSRLSLARDEIEHLRTQLASCNGELTSCESNLNLTLTHLSSCTAALVSTESALAVATADADGDGIPDRFDTCPNTATGAAVDSTGCSLAQFCATANTSSLGVKMVCPALDWQNDEPIMRAEYRDCRVDPGPTKKPADDTCVPVEPPQ